MGRRGDQMFEMRLSQYNDHHTFDDDDDDVLVVCRIQLFQFALYQKGR